MQETSTMLYLLFFLLINKKKTAISYKILVQCFCIIHAFWSCALAMKSQYGYITDMINSKVLDLFVD